MKYAPPSELRHVLTSRIGASLLFLVIFFLQPFAFPFCCCFCGCRLEVCRFHHVYKTDRHHVLSRTASARLSARRHTNHVGGMFN